MHNFCYYYIIHTITREKAKARTRGGLSGAYPGRPFLFSKNNKERETKEKERSKEKVNKENRNKYIFFYFIFIINIYIYIYIILGGIYGYR